MKNKAQSYLIYAALVALIAASLIIISGYLRQRIQGSYKQAGDALGMGELKD
jgi:Flp pilus assembly pilin Flp